MKSYQKIDDKFIMNIICSDCGKIFQTKFGWYRRVPENYIWRCRKCSYKNRGKINSINYFNKSEEEKEIQLNNLFKGRDKYWCNDGEKERRSIKAKEQYKNLSDEKKKQNSDRASATFKKYRDNMSIEDKEKFSIRSRKQVQDFWKNATIKDRESHRNEISKSYKNRSKDKKRNIYQKISNKLKNRWNNLNEEDFLKWSKSHSEGIASSKKLRGPTESIFANDLNKYSIKYKWGYSNNTIHPDFYNTFGKTNPITIGNISPYKAWDFLIYTKHGNILVDIDGSKHSSLYNNDNFVISKIQFNDSKRPYQTDGLDAYIIECYDDKLEDDTKVLDMQSNKYISYKDLLNMIQLMNYSDKELREILL